MAYIAVFSSLPRLVAVLDERVTYVEMPVRDFLPLCQGANILLNPGSEIPIALPAQRIEALLDGSIGQPTEQYTVNAPTGVRMGPPAEQPGELVRALKGLFAKHKAVQRAWLVLLQDLAREEKPHTLIVIEMRGDDGRLQAEMGIVLQAVAIPDPPVDAHLVATRAEAERGLPATIRPFYERKVLGMF